MTTAASEQAEPSTAYRLHASDVIAGLKTDERRGLHDDEAGARLARYGPNELAGRCRCPSGGGFWRSSRMSSSFFC